MRLTVERVNERQGGRVATRDPLTRGARGPVRLIGRIVAEWRCRRRRAAALRELRAWDDRALKDIGLTRGEIRAAVDGELDRVGPAAVRRCGG
ncbi:MAG TPA: DUF1127 domain-containing protein [Geminicoccaceae bacterium]|nr:DUF1127 domain-containing protein [Geminicoccaceae bacterium]